MVVLYAAVFPV